MQVAPLTSLLGSGSVLPPSWLGVMQVTAAQRLFFHGDARGYADSSAALGPFGTLDSNTTGKTVNELWLYNGIAGGGTGKVFGYNITVTHTEAMTQDAWTNLDVVDGLSQLLISAASSDVGTLFFVTDNMDGTWTMNWQYTTTPTVLDPVPDTFTFTLT